MTKVLDHLERLSVRTGNVLRRNGLSTPGAVAALRPDQIAGMSRLVQSELEDWLSGYGLGFATQQPRPKAESLRDYFAAAALQGFLAAGEYHDFRGQEWHKRRAGTCYELADAMMEARGDEN